MLLLLLLPGRLSAAAAEADGASGDMDGTSL